MTKIDFNDLSYIDKRKELQKFSHINGYAYTIELYVKDGIINKILWDKSNKDGYLIYILDELVDDLLINGYISYEKILDDDENVIGYNKLDPTSLFCTINKKSIYWTQYKGDSNERVLTNEQVLYLAYEDIIKNANTSLIGQIYTEQILLYNNNNKMSDFIVKYIIDNISNKISSFMKK